MGQDLQRHILKCAGGPMPQLQAVGILVQFAHWGHILMRELSPAISFGRIAVQLRGGKALQKAVHDIDHPLLVGHVPHGLHCGGGQPGQHCRGQQPAVWSQSLCNSLGGTHAQVFISRAQIVHGYLTTLIKLL